MATACTSDCVRDAMGFQSESQYVTDYGTGCIGKEQKIYCINGQPSIAPRGCTKVFGEARHDYAGADYQWPFGGTSAAPVKNNVGTPVSVTFTNDTCYSMNLQLEISSSLNYSFTGDASVQFGYSIPITVNGVLQFVSAGGSQGLRGNTSDPFDVANATHSPVPAAPNHLITPGQTMTLSIYLATNATAATTVNDRIYSFSSACRVFGTTVCP